MIACASNLSPHHRPRHCQWKLKTRAQNAMTTWRGNIKLKANFFKQPSIWLAYACILMRARNVQLYHGPCLAPRAVIDTALDMGEPLCIKHIIWIIESTKNRLHVALYSFLCLIHTHRRRKRKKANELRMRNGKLCNNIVEEKRRARAKTFVEKFKIAPHSPTFVLHFEPRLIAICHRLGSTSSSLLPFPTCSEVLCG